MKKLLCWFFKSSFEPPPRSKGEGANGTETSCLASWSHYPLLHWLVSFGFSLSIGWWVWVSRFLLADEFGFLTFYWLMSFGFSLFIGWWTLDYRFPWAVELLNLVFHWLVSLAFLIRTGFSFWSNLFSLLIGQSQWIRIFSFLLSVECWVCWVMNILFSLVESNLKFKKSDPDQY